MDQLIYASLSHTHYWYEVGMLKVTAKYTPMIHWGLTCRIGWALRGIRRLQSQNFMVIKRVPRWDKFESNNIYIYHTITVGVNGYKYDTLHLRTLSMEF